MNRNQKAFLRTYLRTGDKIAAYRLAYPKAKQSSIKSAANRLLRTNPDIAKAVSEKDRQLDERAENVVLEQKKRKYIALGEVRELLAEVIRGQALNEKIYKTREGVERLKLTPTISQKLAAANACIRLEGWGRHRQPARAKQEKQKEEKQPEEPVVYDVYIAGLPMEEYSAHYTRTIDAYFDKEDGTCKSDPNSYGPSTIFLDIQKRREARKDAERDARMTPELHREETLAMQQLRQRPADDGLYLKQADVIDELWEKYLEGKDEKILNECRLLQTLCGLRFLHHRHRYEAEQEAGWEFHPFNNNLVRKAPSGSPHGGGKATTLNIPVPLPGGGREDLTQGSPGGVNTATAGNKNEAFLKPSPKRQQTETKAPSGSPQGGEKATTINIPAPPPGGGRVGLQGYTPLSELLQDEWDYYIRNQGSTTYRQLNDLKRFSAHRNAPPEVREQIEKETGWRYHPADTSYAKRDPKRPLVRTKFPGPPRY